MKFGIIVCLLVVLACREAACDNQLARIEGTCSPKDFSAEELSKCMLITCTKTKDGISSIRRQRCPPICFDPEDKSESQSGDANRPYPFCCPKSSKVIPGHLRVCT